TATSGTLNFRNDRYDITRALVDLPPSRNADPILNIQGESQIRGYRVIVGLTGPLSQPVATVRSEPALPQADVVSLITTGQLSSGDTSSSILSQSEVGAATSLLTDALINAPAQRATSKVFGLTRFEINPIIGGTTGSTPAARLTLGRRISKEVTVTYSTNVTSDPNQILALEYRVSDRLSFLAQYEQASTRRLSARTNNFQFEIRFRKRFGARGKLGLAAAKKYKKHRLLLVVIIGFSLLTVARASKDARIEDYEGRQVSAVELVFEGTENVAAAQAEFISLLKVAPNTQFSAVHVRDSLQSLFDSGRVANARVEVIEEGASRTGPVKLRFVVQRQVQIGDVRIELGPVTGSPISTDELRSRMNFVQSNNRLTKQIIERNADEIQVYLRDRGYFNATVEPAEQLGPRGLRATVTYKVTPGPQAK